MPRETVRMNKNSDPGNIFDVKVGWTKDSYMQIGLEETDERSLFWVLLEDKAEWIGAEVRRIVAESNDKNRSAFGDSVAGDTEIGKNILNMLDCATKGPVGGIWTTPGRHEVNELIRLLRRARDSAFGRDE